jgi:hypothetical protein
VHGSLAGRWLGDLRAAGPTRRTISLDVSPSVAGQLQDCRKLTGCRKNLLNLHLRLPNDLLLAQYRHDRFVPAGSICRSAPRTAGIALAVDFGSVGRRPLRELGVGICQNSCYIGGEALGQLEFAAECDPSERGPAAVLDAPRDAVNAVRRGMDMSAIESGDVDECPSATRPLILALTLPHIAGSREQDRGRSSSSASHP